MRELHSRESWRSVAKGAARLCATMAVTGLALAGLASCASLAPAKPSLTLLAANDGGVELGGVLPVSALINLPGGPPEIEWTASAGAIRPTGVANEIDFLAPAEKGEVTVKAKARVAGRSLSAETKLRVLPVGALKKTADVVVEVDCGTLRKVWVDEAHPAESFTPPLGIKGTFGLDPDTGEATAGGSWPLFPMYDDGTHGDRVAGDGVWTIRLVFKKTGSKVYFAFDDANAYRVGFESGLAWRLKLAWRGVDAAGAGEVSDANNLFFVPDHDQVVQWTAAMAASSGMYAPPAAAKPKSGN